MSTRTKANPFQELGMDITGTDLFCGAGGFSIGFEAAGGRLHMAANHWDKAIETHQANFPGAHHDQADLSQVEPRRYPSTTILTASPSCTHHSRANTSRRKTQEFDPKADPAAERSRATMWDVVRFAEHHHYQIVVVENVVEVRNWAPYPAWLAAMHSIGYDHRELFLNSMVAHPTPQSRDRIYIVFWRRGNRVPDLEIRPKGWCAKHGEVEAVQVFKKPNAPGGKYRQQYLYRCPRCAEPVALSVYPAASAIDFSIPCPRIGDRARPLSENTRRRIELGLAKHGPHILQRYGNTFCRPNSGYSRTWGLDEPTPTMMTDVQHGMVVPLHHGGSRGPDPRSVMDVWPTQTGRQENGLVMPFITELRGGGSGARYVDQPLATITAAGNHHGLVTPPGFVVKNYGDGRDPSMSLGLGDPLATVTTQDHHSVVQMPDHFLASYYGNGGTSPVRLPAPTMRTHDAAALIEPGISVDDCGFRMLTPEEVGRAMAFPDWYQVLGTNRDRVRMYGNAVTPPMTAEIIGRCVRSLLQEAA